MKVPPWLTFLIKSIALGVIISVLILALVPNLRKGSGASLDWLGPKIEVPEKVSYYDAISQSAPAVVNIYSAGIVDIRSSFTRRQQVERRSQGSGVIMNGNGYILTCWHVINDAEANGAIFVGLHDGRIMSAEIVGYDTVTDLAVLKISAENLNVIPQLEDPHTRIGDVVLAIGNPHNLGQTITQGIVSRTGRTFIGDTVSANAVNYIQTDAVLNEGNSGGALVDSNGHLVGINNASFKSIDGRGRQVRDVNGVFFAVPYQLAKRVMDEIIGTGRAAHGQLGFTGNPGIGFPGIVVSDLVPGGAADRAGLKEGDIVTAINGETVENVIQALDKVSNSSPGTVLTLDVMRGDQKVVIPITVAELSSPR